MLASTLELIVEWPSEDEAELDVSSLVSRAAGEYSNVDMAVEREVLNIVAIQKEEAWICD